MKPPVDPLELKSESIVFTNDEAGQAARTRAKFSVKARFCLFGIAVVFLLIIVLGLAAACGLGAREIFLTITSGHDSWILQGISIALAYNCYGLSLMFIAPSVNQLFQMMPEECEGNFESMNVPKWYFHNGLHYLARYTYLEWTLLSPLANAYYRMLGMKIGKNCLINSSSISDPCMIELGDNVTIGGSATIMGHYAGKDYLNIKKVVFKNGASIGAKAIVLAGVTVGENSTVLPNSYVPPNTVIPNNEIWGGVPAKKISARGNDPLTCI